MKTAQEFRDFFSAIPDEKWTMKFYRVGEQRCAFGHLGVRNDFEDDACTFDKVDDAKVLRDLFADASLGSVADVNDGDQPTPFRLRELPNPKARILAALDEIIAKESK